MRSSVFASTEPVISEHPWPSSDGAGGGENTTQCYGQRPDAAVAVRVEVSHRGGEGPARARLCALLPEHGRIWRGPAQLLLSRAQPLSRLRQSGNLLAHGQRGQEPVQTPPALLQRQPPDPGLL